MSSSPNSIPLLCCFRPAEGLNRNTKLIRTQSKRRRIAFQQHGLPSTPRVSRAKQQSLSADVVPRHAPGSPQLGAVPLGRTAPILRWRRTRIWRTSPSLPLERKEIEGIVIQKWESQDGVVFSPQVSGVAGHPDYLHG